MNDTILQSPSSQQSDKLTGRTLRKLYLTLFLRGRMSRGFKKETSPKSVWRKLGVTLLVYALFGAAIAATFHGAVFVLSLYLHATTTMVLGMFIVMSAGDALFNKDESEILMHRPVSSRILLYAKISVLVVVALWIAAAFNLGSFIAGAFTVDGTWMYPVAHAMSTAFEACFCVSCVVLLYQLCLHWFGRERLDNLMTMVQVVMGVAFVAISQIVPRMMERSETITTIAQVWWINLLPPAWFAGIDDALAGSGAWGSWELAGVAVVATTIVSWLAFVKLAEYYEAGLQKISETHSKPTERVKERRRLQWLVNTQPIRWWLGDSLDRAAFILCSAYLLRDRDVKLRVFPGIAPMLVLPIVFLLQQKNGSAMGSAMSIGFLGMLPLFAQNLLQYSEQWQASDLFRAAPMLGPAALCNGARHAVLLLITLPMLIILLVATILIQGSWDSVLIMIPGIIALPLFALWPCFRGNTIPLSIAGDEAKAAGRSLKMFLFMIVAGGFGGIVALSWKFGFFGWLLAVEPIVVIVLYRLMKQSLLTARWASME